MEVGVVVESSLLDVNNNPQQVGHRKIVDVVFVELRKDDLFGHSAIFAALDGKPTAEILWRLLYPKFYRPARLSALLAE